MDDSGRCWEVHYLTWLLWGYNRGADQSHEILCRKGSIKIVIKFLKSITTSVATRKSNSQRSWVFPSKNNSARDTYAKKKREKNTTVLYPWMVLFYWAKGMWKQKHPNGMIPSSSCVFIQAGGLKKEREWERRVVIDHCTLTGALLLPKEVSLWARYQQPCRINVLFLQMAQGRASWAYKTRNGE